METKNKEYVEFLEKKKHSAINYGIDPVYIPDYMFDFQQHVAIESIIKGRYADFIDTGLGKPKKQPLDVKPVLFTDTAKSQDWEVRKVVREEQHPRMRALS